MRDAYHEELDSIGDGLVEMARLVGSAIGRATTALLDADLKIAESVIAADEKVDDLQRELETRAIDLLARQQPVATDLRIVVTSLRMSADLERSGDLARHVAKLARLRFPVSAVPLRPAQHAAGDGAAGAAADGQGRRGDHLQGRRLRPAAGGRTTTAWTSCTARSSSTCWTTAGSTASRPRSTSRCCGRYYERFADHAVSVAKRVVYLVTGEHPDELTPAIPVPGEA